jgi:hypothetical protein
VRSHVGEGWLSRDMLMEKHDCPCDAIVVVLHESKLVPAAATFNPIPAAQGEWTD